MSLRYFNKLPPSVSVPAFYCFITVVLFYRFLTASVFGIFLLTVGLYWYIGTYTLIDPLTPSELVSWIDGLSLEYKVALLSSLITIAGFVVAFHTATLNWRNQMRAQLKAQAAGEIENFFSVVSSNMTTTSLYVESLIDIVDKIQEGATVESSSYSIGYLQGKAREFMEARDTLSQASIDVHRLIGRNYNLLSTGWGTLKDTNLAAQSLTNFSEKMWITVPIVDLENSNHIQSFLNQVNVTECTEFLNTYEDNFVKITGLSGGVKGNLTAPIWGVSLPMFINLLAIRKELKEVIKEFHAKFKSST